MNNNKNNTISTTKPTEFLYNTDQKPLIFKEYGRSIVRLVEKALAIPDLNRRTAFVKYIVNMLLQMYPHLRGIENIKPRLLTDLYIISGYRLNIIADYEKPTEEERFTKPQRLKYPQNQVKRRHYGKYLPELIEQTINCDNPIKKAAMLRLVISFLKQAYKMWNKEIPNDDIVRTELDKLSDGQLHIGDQPISSRSSRKRSRKRAAAANKEVNYNTHHLSNVSSSGNKTAKMGKRKRFR